MKQIIFVALMIFAGAILLSPVASVSPARGAAKNVTAQDRGFSVWSTSPFTTRFHLQHEALPQKDFKRIRAAAAKLWRLEKQSSKSACRAAWIKISIKV